MPIHSSNAMIYNSKTKKPDRVGVLKLKDNKKVRVYKSTGEQIDL
jgi:large subunit ribosomal protein L24